MQLKSQKQQKIKLKEENRQSETSAVYTEQAKTT